MLLLNLLAKRAISFLFVLFFSISNIYAVKVGVVVPLQHEAMNQIVSGIEEALEDTDVEIIVKNAQGDTNIMSALIKQMRDDEDIKIIMPIGTSTSQMVLANIKDRPVVCVAAKFDKPIGPQATGVNDEIPISIPMQKLKSLHKIAIIYSASEKVTPEIDELKKYADSHGVTLHLSMIQNLTDLPSAVKSAPDDTDSFLILKDHLVVSGINVIAKEAEKRSIPVIASDEGSVINGATIAIGVPEKMIGYESGQITKMILEGKNPSDIPYKNIDSLILFVNNYAFDKQKILTKEMLTELGLKVEVVEKK